MGGFEFASDEGNYPTRAYGFSLAEDLYLFFRFESPKSDCEIGIGFDQYIDAGDWYVSDGHLDGNDDGIVEDVVFNRLAETGEWQSFAGAVLAAAKVFNGEVRS